LTNKTQFGGGQLVICVVCSGGVPVCLALFVVGRGVSSWRRARSAEVVL
jgi:hypothetical protein